MTGKDGVRRYSMFFAGVPICAAGIALITRAGLGTSPISSIPFVLSLITPPTMGVYTFVFNMLFLACEALLLRRFTALQALQIPATLVFSACIDLALDLIPTQYGGPALSGGRLSGYGAGHLPGGHGRRNYAPGRGFCPRPLPCLGEGVR